MKKCMLGCMILSLALLMVGCITTAGPFVTDISRDGKGNLIVEKKKLRIDFPDKTATTYDTTTKKIGVTSEYEVDELKRKIQNLQKSNSTDLN